MILIKISFQWVNFLYPSQVDAASNCAQFRSQLTDLHERRNHMIGTCLATHQELLANAPNENARRSAQRVVRSLKQEQGVEKIVNERSSTFFDSKCSPFANLTDTL